MKTFFQSYFAILISAFAVSACGGGGRALIIRSEPADADVCIKGRSNSEYFSNQKSCVGTTPFEAEKVEVTDPNGGDKRTVHFKDVDKNRESFYVVVSRQGYASQAIEVPGWDHMVVLKPKGAAAAAPAPSIPLVVERGSVRITSDPLGALVYIDGQLKGNTPYTHEGAAGVVKMKLELEGYVPVEKALTVEPKGNISLNFKMLSGKVAEGAGMPASGGSQATAPGAEPAAVPASAPATAAASAPAPGATTGVVPAAAAAPPPAVAAPVVAAPPPPAPLEVQPITTPPPVE